MCDLKIGYWAVWWQSLHSLSQETIGVSRKTTEVEKKRERQRKNYC